MLELRHLSPADRSFLASVREAAFANPFGDERRALDLHLAGMVEDQPDRVKRALAAVRERVDRLESDGAADIRRYRSDDRDLLVMALLFDAFHRFLPALDKLILDQEQAGDTPVHVRFAGDLTHLLARRGFSSEAILHVIAVFYQLRRAFYFISRGLLGRSPCMKELRRRMAERLHLQHHVV